MADSSPIPTATDIRVFVPALDFEQSLRFYTRLGWTLKWQADDNSLALLEFAHSRFFLQNFYVKAWAENFVFQVLVDDAAAWHDHVAALLAAESFGQARVNTPRKEPFGAITTHVWDPSGVLINLTQF